MLPSNQLGFAGPHLAVPQLYWSHSLFWPPHALIFRWSQASVRKILTLCVFFFIFSSLLRHNLQANQNLISLLLLMFMLGKLFPSSSHAGSQQEFHFFWIFLFFLSSHIKRQSITCISLCNFTPSLPSKKEIFIFWFQARFFLNGSNFRSSVYRLLRTKLLLSH